jgi:drug/metabolite transporter (DMT)-like permease
MTKLILFSSCIIAVFADMLLVWWAKGKTHPAWSIVVAMILVNVAGLIWAYAMYKGIESTTAIISYSLLTVAGCSFLGYFFFQETLSITNAIGLILGIIALIMISV